MLRRSEHVFVRKCVCVCVCDGTRGNFPNRGKPGKWTAQALQIMNAQKLPKDDAENYSAPPESCWRKLSALQHMNEKTK